MGRVVVTGVGPVSGIGSGADAYRAGLCEGVSGVGEITAFDATGFPHRRAGEVRDVRPEDRCRGIDVTRWGRTSVLAAVAARMAVTDAGLDERTLADRRTAIAVGTTAGESKTLEDVLRTDPAAAGVEDIVPANRISEAVARELGVPGPVLTFGTACAASNYALAYAYDLLSLGEYDAVVVGGADSVQQWLHAGFTRLGAIAESDCAPFDRDRSGIVTAEGAAMLVLETAGSARARGARVYAELLGAGLNCDATHMVAPQRASIADCMRLALADSGVAPADVDWIAAHGTGTPSNDAAEIGAVRDVFGSDVPPVSSVKSMLGHTMGAASGMSAIGAVLGIAYGFVCPTINVTTVDPEFGDLDVVPGRARQQEVDTVMVNGFAFGGNNAIVVFGRYDA